MLTLRSRHGSVSECLHSCLALHARSPYLHASLSAPRRVSLGPPGSVSARSEPRQPTLGFLSAPPRLFLAVLSLLGRSRSLLASLSPPPCRLHYAFVSRFTKSRSQVALRSTNPLCLAVAFASFFARSRGSPRPRLRLSSQSVRNCKQGDTR